MSKMRKFFMYSQMVLYFLLFLGVGPASLLVPHVNKEFKLAIDGKPHYSGAAFAIIFIVGFAWIIMVSVPVLLYLTLGTSTY